MVEASCHLLANMINAQWSSRFAVRPYDREGKRGQILLLRFWDFACMSVSIGVKVFWIVRETQLYEVSLSLLLHSSHFVLVSLVAGTLFQKVTPICRGV